MNKQIMQDWLAECAALSPVEMNSFASSLKHNSDIINALYEVFEDYTNYPTLIDPVSKQLFHFYRSREVELKLFTLQFLPNLIYIYLNSVARGDKKSYHSIETLLISIYNLEVVDDAGQPAVISFRLPSLAQASIYHEPMSLAHASLTETALRRLEDCNTKLISWGPHPQVETLNAQNRLKTMAGLVFIYNRHIASLNKMSLKYFCDISSRLARQGFKDSLPPNCDCPESETVSPNSKELKGIRQARIPLSSQLFLELLCGLYYAMYNEFGYPAMQAVVDIYNRSCFECYSNVILVANAIKNSSHITSKGQTTDGPMGISVALSPATTTVTTVNKFMITNASFRTKKLPDDIPIITKDDSGVGTDALKALSSITEEKEESGFSARGSSLRSKDTMTKNFQKLGITKKFKDKEGKLLLKTVTAGFDKKQFTSFPMSTFKDKVPSKSSVVHNGNFVQADVDSLSSLSSNKKKVVENGPCTEVFNGSVSESVGADFLNENQSEHNNSFDKPSSSDDVIDVFSSNNKTDDKPFKQVSSV